jgi:uncharacterized membrane protein YvbJ
LNKKKWISPTDFGSETTHKRAASNKKCGVLSIFEHKESKVEAQTQGSEAPKTGVKPKVNIIIIMIIVVVVIIIIIVTVIIKKKEEEDLTFRIQGDLRMTETKGVGK